MVLYTNDRAYRQFLEAKPPPKATAQVPAPLLDPVELASPAQVDASRHHRAVLDELVDVDPRRHHRRALDEMAQFDVHDHHRKALGEMAQAQQVPTNDLASDLAQMRNWRERSADPILQAMNIPITGPRQAGEKGKSKEKLAPEPSHHGYAKLTDQTKTWLRRTFGQFPGLTMSSGYRDVAHNRAVGGVPGSAHTKGMAFDAMGPAPQMQAAAKWLKSQGVEAFVHPSSRGTMHLHVEFGHGGI